MASGQVVRYAVGDGVVVGFEIEPVEGFVPAGADEVAGRVRSAVEPAVAAARAVLGRVRELSPDGVEVKFGVKVTGTANWLVAKAATEGNFEVTLSWSPGSPQLGGTPGLAGSADQE
jgi:hypothetical protein